MMTLKSMFKVIFGSMVLLLITMGITAVFMFQDLKSLNESHEVRYKSRNLADELRQSSDDLTRFAKLYVVTGDPKFEQYYWDILAIRNGEKKRPQQYHNIYWDFVAADGKKPQADGSAISLQQLMQQMGFTEREFAKLSEAQQNSDALVHTETIAFHAMKGQFEDDKGTFTKAGPPDQALAIRLMHDEAYI